MTAGTVLSRRHLITAMASPIGDRDRPAATPLEVVTTANLVAIVIARRPGAETRATLWATPERAAVTTLIGGDRFEIRGLERRLLVLEACRLTGIGRHPSPPTRPGTEHRSMLGRWRLDGRPIVSHWELAIVSRTSTQVATASLEAIDVAGTGSYEVQGDTWVTLTPMSGDAASRRIATAFGD